jgi:hypothetical protein
MGKMARVKVTEARKTGRGTKALLLGSIGLFRASSWITQGLGPVWDYHSMFFREKKCISTNLAIAERWNCEII